MPTKTKKKTENVKLDFICKTVDSHEDLLLKIKIDNSKERSFKFDFTHVDNLFNAVHKEVVKSTKKKYALDNSSSFVRVRDIKSHIDIPITLYNMIHKIMKKEFNHFAQLYIKEDGKKPVGVFYDGRIESIYNIHREASKGHFVTPLINIFEKDNFGSILKFLYSLLTLSKIARKLNNAVYCHGKVAFPVIINTVRKTDYEYNILNKTVEKLMSLAIIDPESISFDEIHIPTYKTSELIPYIDDLQKLYTQRMEMEKENNTYPKLVFPLNKTSISEMEGYLVNEFLLYCIPTDCKCVHTSYFLHDRGDGTFALVISFNSCLNTKDMNEPIAAHELCKKCNSHYDGSNTSITYTKLSGIYIPLIETENSK